MARRNKGSPFEREICLLLTKWWLRDDDPEDTIFWRTAGSGGRATVRGKRGRRTSKQHCGDIAALDDQGRALTDLITFELKRGYNPPRNHVTLTDLIDRPKAVKHQEGLEVWVEQAERSALNAGTPHWAIIHRRDTRDAVVIMPGALLDDLESVKQFPPPVAQVWVRLHKSDLMTLRQCVAAIRLDTFLATVSPETVRRLDQEYRHETKRLLAQQPKPKEKRA